MEDAAAAAKQLPVTTVTVASSPPVSVAVELLTAWAILTGHCVGVVPTLAVCILHYFNVQCTPSSVVLRCVDLTDAEAAEKAALWEGVLWCTLIRMAVAELAQVLPSRRRRIRIRRCLAFVALVVAILGHCFYAAVVRLVATADPGYLFYTTSCSLTIFVLAVGDVFMFTAFLLSPGGED